MSAARHGETLLDSIRQVTGKGTAADQLGNVAAIERFISYQLCSISHFSSKPKSNQTTFFKLIFKSFLNNFN